MIPKPGHLVEVVKDCFALVCSEEDSLCGGFGANQCFILLENSVLAFDSGFSIFQASNLEKAIRGVTDNKVRYLINSHDHSDHVFGNAYFWKKYSPAGLTIVSHEICKDRLIVKGPNRLKAYRKVPGLESSLRSVEIHSADTTYSDPALRIEIDGKKFVLSHPPTGAHTLGDSVLFLPKQGLIFAGDVVWNRFYPNLEDANLEGWISYLNEIDLDTYQKIVPGHGEVCGPERVRGFTEYLVALRTNLLKVDPKRASTEKLRSCFLWPGSESWKLSSIIDYNIQQIFGKRT